MAKNELIQNMSESSFFVVNCEKEVPRICIENNFPFFYQPCVLKDLFFQGRSRRNFADKPQGPRSPSQRRSNIVQDVRKDFAGERIKKINHGYFIGNYKLSRVRRNEFDVAAFQTGQCAAHIFRRNLIQLRSDLHTVNLSERIFRGHDNRASHSRAKVEKHVFIGSNVKRSENGLKTTIVGRNVRAKEFVSNPEFFQINHRFGTNSKAPLKPTDIKPIGYRAKKRTNATLSQHRAKTAKRLFRIHKQRRGDFTWHLRLSNPPRLGAGNSEKGRIVDFGS